MVQVTGGLLRIWSAAVLLSKRCTPSGPPLLHPACVCSTLPRVVSPKVCPPQHRKAAEQMYKLCVDLRGFYLKVSLRSTACRECMPLLLLCGLLC